ncbi:MAG: VWA domain-containing protein [Lentisphaerae bacterium]|nr:VWA domain-containing protein [Lentisphaerota bacterium]
MKYTDPYILLLIPAVLILILFLYAGAARRRKRLLTDLLGNKVSDPDSLHLSETARRWKLILYIAAMTVIIAGSARPYLKKIPVPLKNSGRDIIVLFDVSKSMRATDLPPSRLEQAKFLLREIVKSSPGDRFGLVAFAGNAFLSCPLTADPAAVNEYINELDTDTVPLGGTNIERALRVAERAFKGSEGSSRAILMLTDGDALSGNAERLLPQFKSAGIPLLIAGLGDPAIAAPVPDGKGGFMRQMDGKVASSTLNESALAKLAAETGGIYIRSTVSDTGSSAITSALAKLAAKERDSGRSFQVDEKFPWFFAAGFILVIIAGFISEAPGKAAFNKAKTTLILAAIFLGMTASAAETDSTGQEENLPADALQLYNLAIERQKNNDPSALRLYEEVIRKSAGNQELQSRALHNFGTGCHQEGRAFFDKARQQLAQQQPDAALKELDSAETKIKSSQELYTQSLSVNSSASNLSAANLRQTELDRKEIEKLKKQIEELKKQQQQAQQQTQQALNRNQQQNQQNNNQPQNKQSKQDQSRQNPQNQQQNQSQDQQIRQAAQSAAKLEKQAGDLKQEKLKQNAANARKELEEAARKQEENRPAEDIRKHLEAAAKSLGEPDSQEKDQNKKQPGKAEKPQTGSGKANPGEAEQRREEKKRNAEEQLQMLNNESARLRQNMRKRNSSGTPPATVEKDW